MVRLGDVAEVRKEYPDPDSYITNNFDKCILLSVSMKDGYNIVEMGKEVDAQLEKARADMPESVTLFKITDQPVVVNKFGQLFSRRAADSHNRGVVVVIMILLAAESGAYRCGEFRCRSLSRSDSSMPFDIELNTVTLACLIVSLGMIVDNSVVIIDDYVELISEGMDHMSATLRSGTEFFKAIFSATLAISVTFFPFLLTVTGMFRDFLTDFPGA